LFLVTSYKLKPGLTKQQKQELARSARDPYTRSTQNPLYVPRKKLPMPPNTTHYTTLDGTSGVFIIATHLVSSDWMDEFKIELSPWIEFSETEVMHAPEDAAPQVIWEVFG
jgi:hypothetical protein